MKTADHPMFNGQNSLRKSQKELAFKFDTKGVRKAIIYDGDYNCW